MEVGKKCSKGSLAVFVAPSFDSQWWEGAEGSSGKAPWNVIGLVLTSSLGIPGVGQKSMLQLPFWSLRLEP